jgi:hypothetical protein
MVLPLVLFAGFDIGFVTPGKGMGTLKISFVAILSAIIVTIILFLVWGHVMMNYLPAQKLSRTAITHIINCKKDPG